MSTGSAARLEALAEDAWLLQLGDRIDVELNSRVHALCARLQQHRPHWLRDLVPAYASLAVFFDARWVEAETVGDWLLAQTHELSHTPPSVDAVSRVVEVPIVYGGDYGPDLDTAAAELGLTPQQLAARHAAGEYTVAMIGFAPGFPYLLGLDPALALPRLATPRTRVPAGSVGIGGAQTGIYPRESPGGWRLIGRTPLTLFDAARDAPAALAPGDRVRFRVIDANAFANARTTGS